MSAPQDSEKDQLDSNDKGNQDRKGNGFGGERSGDPTNDYRSHDNDRSREAYWISQILVLSIKVSNNPLPSSSR